MPYHIEVMHQGAGIPLTGMTELRLTTEDLRRVVVEDQATARMGQAFVEDTGWNTAVLRSRAEAIDWLREIKVWLE